MPAAELAARLAEAYRLIGELTARVEQLERQVRKDSSTSSRPPSSDSLYQKSRDRSLRKRGKRRPGKQPGDPGPTMRLVDDPDDRLEFPQAKQCPCCGTVTEGELPPHVRARASYRPETCAQAANLTTGHHIPIWRSTLVLCQLAGIAVSTGWMAPVRGKAAGPLRTWRRRAGSRSACRSC